MSEKQAPAEKRPRWRLVAAALAACLLVAALVTAGVVGWKLKQNNDVDNAAAAAESAARDYAVTLTAVDSTKLDENFQAVLDGATGEFKDMYAQASNGLQQLLVANKASATGTVVDSGIKSASKDRVEVLLFVDQSVTNSANPEPRIDRSRLVITMVLVDGRWLAEKVDLV